MISCKNGKKSPDIIDAASFAFLEDANEYMVADNVKSMLNSASENAKAKFALYVRGYRLKKSDTTITGVKNLPKVSY